MKNEKICKTLFNFFNNANNIQFDLFMFDPNKCVIFMEESCKTNKEKHEQLFIELQHITEQLNTLQCDYSIDINGDILLNCISNDSDCKER